MKKEIKEIYLGRMRNGAHFMYMKKVLLRAKADAAVMAKAEAYVNDFETAVNQEDACLVLSQKSLNTDEIALADQDCDAIYMGYKKAVPTFLELRVPELAKAAKVLWQHIVDFGIDTKMQLDLEAGLMMNFIADLEGKYAAEVTTLGLTAFVTNLKASHQRLITLIEARDEERMGKTVGALKTARKATDLAYRLLVKTVNAYAWIEGDAELGNFIDYVNVQVKHYKQEALGQNPGSEEGLPEGGTTTPDTDTGGTDEGGTDEGGETPDTGGSDSGTEEGGTTPPATGGGDDEDDGGSLVG